MEARLNSGAALQGEFYVIFMMLAAFGYVLQCCADGIVVELAQPEPLRERGRTHTDANGNTRPNLDWYRLQWKRERWVAQLFAYLPSVNEGPPGGPEVNEPRSYALGMRSSPASAGLFQQSVIRMISILETNISFKQVKINIKY
ncbi:unnamed protein product [Phytophthora lilii]|uniref:Unnamed protein product n=1 Tax=Phytophthora lilii TaxID=2077276 RepID=A0A9W6TVQ4_9STRA|nr:unnamed protein product [Phytophthora lilii]